MNNLEIELCYKSKFDVLTINKNTPFFGEKLEECMKNGNGQLFTYDTNDKGAKYFFTCSFFDFVENFYMKRVNSGTIPNMYEVIRLETPVRLYLDVDNTRGVCDTTALIDAIKKKLKDEYNCDNVDMFEMDASTEHKFSRHIIFDVAMKVEEMKLFIGEVVHDKPEWCVDMAVYSQTRSMRLLYSAKKGKTNIFRKLGRENDDYKL